MYSHQVPQNTPNIPSKSSRGWKRWFLLPLIALVGLGFFGHSLSIVQAAPGTGVIGYYYNGTEFQEFVFTRTNARISFNWGTGSPNEKLLDNDNYSIRWVGQILPEHSEEYTFCTYTDDGTRLWVNDQLVVDAWVLQGATEHCGSIDLEANVRYNLKMEYFEALGDSVARLRWLSASTPRDTVPQVNLYPFHASFESDIDLGVAPLTVQFTDTSDLPTAVSWLWDFGDGITSTQQNPTHTYTADGTYNVVLRVTDADGVSHAESQVLVAPYNGLLGEYYSGADFGSVLLRRLDPNVNFNWGTGSPDTAVPNNNFSVRWTGQVKPLYSETYTFCTRTDDGARLWVNGEQLVDEWQPQGPTEWCGDIDLVADQRFNLVMEYQERGGGALAELYWSSASQTKEIIPESQLYRLSTDFTADPQIGSFPLIVNFQDTSVLAEPVTAWLWEFGDGQTSSAQNPVHIYNSVGDYTVTLTITDSEGTVEVTKANYIGVGRTAGIVGEYFSDNNLTYPVLTRIDDQIDFNWGGGSPDTAVLPNNFSVRWQGQIEPLYSETYTFCTIADNGVRLSVGNVQLVNRWTNGNGEDCGDVALEAGYRYNLVMEYYEATGNASAQLFWQSASQTREIVPNAQLHTTWTAFQPDRSFGLAPLDVSFTDISTATNVTAWHWDFGDGVTSTLPAPQHTYAQTGTFTVTLTITDYFGVSRASYPGLIRTIDTAEGFNAEYFADRNLSVPVLERIDSEVDFNWANGSPASGLVPDNNFSVRWTGFISPPESGLYTICTTTDDGVRLSIAGYMKINQWVPQAPTQYCDVWYMRDDQQYALLMEYFEASGGAVAQLTWTRPSGLTEVVPGRFINPLPAGPLAVTFAQIETEVDTPTATEGMLLLMLGLSLATGYAMRRRWLERSRL